MFCKKCGQEIDDASVVCPECGAAQEEKPAVVDNGGFLWGLLGCCVPIVGLVLYLVWKDQKPKTARAAGKGALVCVICTVIYYVLMLVLGIGMGLTGM